MEFKNQYLTFEEYVELGGKLDEMPFNILEFRARKTIDNITFNRLVNLEEQIQEVKMCMYDLINDMENAELNQNKSSESIDGYSVSYIQNNDQSKNINSKIKDYLIECKLEDGTPYMYCGVE